MTALVGALEDPQRPAARASVKDCRCEGWADLSLDQERSSNPVLFLVVCFFPFSPPPN